jgi:hypothetical protein
VGTGDYVLACPSRAFWLEFVLTSSSDTKYCCIVIFDNIQITHLLMVVNTKDVQRMPHWK